MKIQPKPTPTPPQETPAAAKNAQAASPAPKLPPHAFENRTFAEMPDRNSPDWGKPKPQPTVRTGEGELAKIPKHPARMSESELMERYFNPNYKYDLATGKSAEPFFAQPGHEMESPTRETPPTLGRPSQAAPAQASAGLWGGGALAPAPAPAQPSQGLWGGAPLSAPPRSDSPKSDVPTPPEDRAPLLPHERAAEAPPSPQADRYAGFEGWGRNAGHRGGNDYFGSDWD